MWLVDTHGDCHLLDDDVAEMHGFPHAEDRPRRLAIFCDAYGLESHYRAQLVTRMIEVAVQGSAAEAASAGITPGRSATSLEPGL